MSGDIDTTGPVAVNDVVAALEPSLPPPEPTPFDAVFEGGGVKGIGHVGAYAVLRERGFTIRNIVGTSAGAIVAALIAAGYDDPEVLKEIFIKAPLPTFPHKNWAEAHLGLAGEILTVTREDGLYETSAVYAWLKDLLDTKGIHTFGDLIFDKSAPKDSIYRYKAQVVASDITNGRKIILPRDIADYGIDPDSLPVVDAVVMSMSIPLYFQPHKLQYKLEGEDKTSLIVDGGLLSNFPVDIFDVGAGQIPEWPTFGFKLVDPKMEGVAHDTHNIIAFSKSIVTTALEGNDAGYLAEHKFVRTIPIPTLGIQATDWTLSDAKRIDLYQSGRDAAEEFLKRWNFEAYKKVYRDDVPVPHRSTRVMRRLHAALNSP